MYSDNRQYRSYGCSRHCCQLVKSFCLILLLLFSLNSQKGRASDLPIPSEGPDIGHDEDA